MVHAEHKRPGDFRVMPWKNGKGSTTELLIEPPGATVATGFLWRLSMAPVEVSGPFSVFPGMDRSLLLVAGSGLELDHGPHGRQWLDAPLDLARFQGDWDTRGVLEDGPCQDFGVIADRARVRHAVTVLRPEPSGTALPQAPTLVLYCLRGRAAVPALGALLEPGELLRLEEPGALEVTGLEGETVLAVVAFHPTQGESI
jgi:environmental stress-induced protein Ves